MSTGFVFKGGAEDSVRQGLSDLEAARYTLLPTSSLFSSSARDGYPLGAASPDSAASIHHQTGVVAQTARGCGVVPTLDVQLDDPPATSAPLPMGICSGRQEAVGGEGTKGLFLPRKMQLCEGMILTKQRVIAAV